MIEYRKANIDDIHELVRLRIDFMKEAIISQTQHDETRIREYLTDYFKETINNDSFIAWLAVESGRIVGTSGLCFYNLPPSFKNLTGKVAYIMNMYTEQEYRNIGIATCLFAKTVEEAKKLGYKKIGLHATEMGRPLYTKFGFKETDNEMVLNLA